MVPVIWMVMNALFKPTEEELQGLCAVATAAKEKVTWLA